MDKLSLNKLQRKPTFKQNNGMRAACFVDMTRRHWVISYRRFVVTYCLLLDWAVGCQKA